MFQPSPCLNLERGGRVPSISILPVHHSHGHCVRVADRVRRGGGVMCPVMSYRVSGIPQKAPVFWCACRRSDSGRSRCLTCLT